MSQAKTEAPIETDVQVVSKQGAALKIELIKLSVATIQSLTAGAVSITPALASTLTPDKVGQNR
jgi:hypothetical protein